MAGQISDETAIIENINQYTKCFTLSGGKFCCNVTGCTAKLSDKSSSIRHLKGIHPELAATIDANKKQPNCAESIEIRTKVNPSKVWNAIVHMMIFASIPFAVLRSKGLRYLMKPFSEAFKNAGMNFTMDRAHVQKCIGEKADEMKKIISSEAQNSMICLLLDIGSRFNRSILGVSIAFWFNGKKRIRTIGMHTLKVQHTGQHLFNVIQMMLREFNISLDQVFSVTSDNAKNMIKAKKLLEKELSDQTDQSSSRNSDNSDGENSDDEDDDAFENIQNNSENDEVFDPEIFNDEYFRDLLTNVRNQFSCSHNSLFTGISCAAHGLHLVVTNAIKRCKEVADIIEKCRTLAKKLRTPKLRNELFRQNQKVALLDVETRWSSLFNMVISVYIQ